MKDEFEICYGNGFQINGVDVHTRDQAIQLFKRDSKEITLLVARSTVDDSVLTVSVVYEKM